MSFVSKTEHYEYLSSPPYVTSSWEPWQSCFVWKKASRLNISDVISGVYMKVYYGSSWTKSCRYYSKIEFQMVSPTSWAILVSLEGHQYGVSVLSFINLRGKSLQITHERYTAQTWNLEESFKISIYPLLYVKFIASVGEWFWIYFLISWQWKPAIWSGNNPRYKYH